MAAARKTAVQATARRNATASRATQTRRKENAHRRLQAPPASARETAEIATWAAGSTDGSEMGSCKQQYSQRNQRQRNPPARSCRGSLPRSQHTSSPTRATASMVTRDRRDLEQLQIVQLQEPGWRGAQRASCSSMLLARIVGGLANIDPALLTGGRNKIEAARPSPNRGCQPSRAAPAPTTATSSRDAAPPQPADSRHHAQRRVREPRAGQHQRQRRQWNRRRPVATPAQSSMRSRKTKQQQQRNPEAAGQLAESGALVGREQRVAGKQRRASGQRRRAFAQLPAAPARA